MKLIQKVDQHEMLRRWAIGEVYREYLNAVNEDRPKEILALLNSGDLRSEAQGIKESLKTLHFILIDCLPPDISWHLVELEVNVAEFDRLLNLPIPELAQITKGKYRLSEASDMVFKNPGLNPRITEILNSFRADKTHVQLSGITLLAKDEHGPFTLIEGNGRLISLYHLHFTEGINIIESGKLEVIMGFSPSLENEEF